MVEWVRSILHLITRDNMSLPPVPVIHINIQANTVPGSGRGRRVTQRNRVHHYVPVRVVETYPTLPEFTPHLSTTTGRHIETQSRIRRKLEEVSAQSEGTLPRIGPVALFATRILSVVEKNHPLNMGLVDLAMDAHVIAYIAVISFLHRRPRMSKKSVKELTQLLDMIHTFLMEATATGGIMVLLKRFVTRNQRKGRMVRMREDLLDLLREIERNDDVDVLSSLNAALNYHPQ
ncbi:hypothetical protein D9619_010104 [Psilocybe cf. subviscida]|uniref:Uncharacterized protein n=1 Tax=Psilocybe cf. subviscida TaxID=2480587 RepID=A0A8H5BLF3_9AGAR|nr:hypothetical protein D9619_010104 [Psilocybe cf. subviscida]